MHQTITFVRHPAPSYGFESGHDNNFLFINGIQPTTSVPYACVTGLRQQILSVNVSLAYTFPSTNISEYLNDLPIFLSVIYTLFYSSLRFFTFFSH
jgi:hypothetical protein